MRGYVGWRAPGHAFGSRRAPYLVDAGKGSEIACVSSVSGGSLTNAWVGLRVDLRSVTPEELRREARPVAVAAATAEYADARPG